jgi:CRP/FNR family transcriptional regulator, cyclic AMP receptor protein
MSPEHLYEIAVWSHDLSEAERKRVLKSIVERNFAKGAHICHRGDRFEGWTGVVNGLIKLSTVTLDGKAVNLAGLPTGAWFGEGSVLKNEPRRYDIVALRDTRLAILDRPTFMWLVGNSMPFLHYLVHHLNERISQFMAAVENVRSFNPSVRLAQCIVWLFNPVLCPGRERHLAISQEELGLLSGVSRPIANASLKTLEKRNLIRLEHGGITVLDLEGLAGFGS